jgi:hypothetical protein
MKAKKSKQNALIVFLIVMTSLFGSMYLAIIAFQDIPKYHSPYLFVVIVSAIGLSVGYIIWKKVKPTILKYSIKKNDDGTMSVFVMMTIICILLFTVNELNILSAYKTNCDSYTIENKYRSESGYSKPEVNTLVVNLINKRETVVCKYNFWISKRIGDEINLCFYESLLGFNYININE